jgi:hypothetical protein
MKSFSKFLLFTFVSLIFVSNVHFVQAQTPTDSASTQTTNTDNSYTLLEPLPLGGDLTQASKTVDLGTYIPALVKLIIGIAGALAVLRIVMGGITYMTSDAFDKKSDAKETINNAIIGLLLAMSAYVILYTINPNLVNFNISVNGLKVGSALNTGLGSCADGTPAPDNDILKCPDGTGTVSGTDIMGADITVQNCPTNVSGQKGIKPCTCVNCVAVDDSSITFKSGVGKKMSAVLYKELKDTAKNLPGFVAWQVTEAWPLTSAHAGVGNTCHYNGSCIDVNLSADKYTGTNGPITDSQLKSMILLGNALADVGLQVSMEVPNSVLGTINGLLTKNGARFQASGFNVNTSAPHLHIHQL